jgi:hypothetical protein
VYSAEVDLGQRLGLHSVDLSVFATSWQGMIGAIGVGGGLNQFNNFRNVWSTGANLGWHGETGRLDWALSLNYAPGRVRLPADVRTDSDQQLAALGVQRAAVDRYGVSALGSLFLPADAMPDFYSTGHVSYALGGGLPRVSLAATVSSPRPQAGWSNDDNLLDPRFLPGPFLPWTLDTRAALESDDGGRFGWRLVVTARTLGTVADSPRIGDGVSPVPGGGLGRTYNPVPQLSAMVEAHVRF